MKQTLVPAIKMIDKTNIAHGSGTLDSKVKQGRGHSLDHMDIPPNTLRA